MRIELNLSPAQSLRQRYLLYWAAPAGFLALLLLVRLALSMPASWREYRAARDAALQEQQHDGQLRQRAAAVERTLERPEYRETLREVQFINGLIEQKKLSLAELTAKVTALLPPQVRLTALALPDASGDPLIRLGIEGGSERDMEDFLTHLEDSPDFQDVTVMNQGFEQKGPNAAPVTINCSARYVGGRTHGR
ncbi:MAG TPA: hypothetical protein VGW33_11535 [Terriglobia bacterium]|nr:hypothetical protein [Terriglobia bacterium]